MENLNLKRVWEICNKLSYEQTKLHEEQDEWVSLLGRYSEYYNRSFDSFLEYYSFKREDDSIIVFNDDKIPYEKDSNNDYSYVPICLLSFSAEEIETWIKAEVEKQLKQQEENKLAEKENLKRELERLNKQYNKL
jgi:hypothetical protein